MSTRPSVLLTTAERRALTQRSNWRAAWLVLSTWLAIFALLAIAGMSSSWWSVVLVLLVLPGRQLSLAVLMHEAGHNTLFASAAANRWVGQWLCALPTFGDLGSYAQGHLEHHRKAGTPQDPDLPNFHAYPVDKKSFARKVLRDLTGQTGIKLLLGIFAGAAGIVGDGKRETRGLLFKQLAVQGALFVLLAAAGITWTYWLWLATFLTTFMLVIRLRQIGEHAAVPNIMDADLRLNTRTVEAPWWQRFLLAPNGVNYHLEHHYMPGVPCYNLRHLRTLLRARGFLDSVESFTGYGQVVRTAVRTA